MLVEVTTVIEVVVVETLGFYLSILPFDFNLSKSVSSQTQSIPLRSPTDPRKNPGHKEADTEGRPRLLGFV